MRTELLGALASVISSLAWAGGPPSPSFTSKPVATRAGEKVKIEFAVDRETDVAVYVDNAKGEVVRHLVAGVLGKNPPQPLKADSLSQSIEWDGLDDDGKKAEGGPLKVRVGLGLNASWGGTAFDEKDRSGPNNFGGVLGLATGPDGRLYLLTRCELWSDHWDATKMHVLRRDGSYEKTIKPFPSNLPLERVKAGGTFVNSFGALNPLIHGVLGNLSFYSHVDICQQPAVTADGKIVLAVRGYLGETRYNGHGDGFLAMLDGDGGISEAGYVGPPLGAGFIAPDMSRKSSGVPSLLASADGKALYLTGIGSHDKWKGTPQPWHAVYRVALPDRGPVQAVFGEPGKAGSDNDHLKDPRGMALDGKGHLLVADFGNDRVVVLNEKDFRFVGGFPVVSPFWVGVHPRTGEVYVGANRTRLMKFSGWRDPVERARIDFAALLDKIYVGFRAATPLCLALDCSAEPPVLWAGCGWCWDVGDRGASGSLVRLEDLGKEFSAPAAAGVYRAPFQWRPAADPTRRFVASRVGGYYGSTLRILEEATGQVQLRGAGTYGWMPRLGPDGCVYSQNHDENISRWGPDGKPKPFAATARHPVLKGRLPAGCHGTSAWERDFYVDRRNDIYAKKAGPQYHGQISVEVYDQEGRHKRTALWVVSDGMYGPRVDPKGNLYVFEKVKPAGMTIPEEFQGRVPPGNVPGGGYEWIYGSIVKFGPAGGAVWLPTDNAQAASLPFTYEGWGEGRNRLFHFGEGSGAPCLSGLRTTGGCLTAAMTASPAWLHFPEGLVLDAAKDTRIVMRLKNESTASQAVLSYTTLERAHEAKLSKAIEIKAGGDFTEHTFDMSGEKDWQGRICRLSLGLLHGAKGSFRLDWVRVGGADSKLVWNFDAEDGPERKLPASMKKEPVAATNRPEGTFLQGALWMRPGFSPMGDMSSGIGGCHCTGTDFDVDDFGRVFAPDAARFRVGVLDTNGNEVLSFGAYGNQDFCGPDSYVLDPIGKFFRPRRADDPAELVSPFAQPEIAFAWIVGLAVTDRYAYVLDAINKRMLRVKLGYAAEGSCEMN